jgi:hypothetical protein
MEIIYLIVFVAAAFIYAYWEMKEQEGLQARVRKARKRLEHDQSPNAKQAFTQASRDYYASLRNDKKLTVYDEQRIANDLQESLPHSAAIIGEYHDKRTTVNVEKAVLRSSEDSPAEIQKGIMLAITSSPNGSATMPEIMTVVAASQENIDEILRKLMIKGLIKVTNRNDGSICYVLDDLT